MKWPSFIFIVLFGTLQAMAQTFDLRGTAKDIQGNPLAFVNVVVVHSDDATLMKGTSTDDAGRFVITGLPAGTYTFSASFIGFQSTDRTLELTTDTDLGDLVMNEEAQALDEVVVRSRTPTVERQPDRLVFKIANTTLTEGDIMQALRRTPGVIVMRDQLTVKGSPDVGVMINEKRVNLPASDILNLLSGTSAGNVESIEVITNPPARYSAEGGTLINIKMAKNLITGYNGAVFNEYSQGVFPKHTVGIDNFFKNEATSLSFNYSYSDETSISRYTDITNFRENGATVSRWEAEQDNIRRPERHTGNLFFDYDFNDRNRLSLSSITSWTPYYERTYESNTDIFEPDGTFLSGFYTLNDSDEDNINTSLYLDFTRQLGEKGAELDFSTHYTYFDSERDQELTTDFFDTIGQLTAENDFVTETAQRIHLFSAQLDLALPLGENSSMETGLRYANIDSENPISQRGFDRNQPGINPIENGEFLYDEATYAAYVEYDAPWDSWHLKAGLRGEFTETTGILDATGLLTSNDYFQLFPSMSLQYTPNETHDYNLYYYRRIERPRYNSINPFQVFQSNNSVVEGNPNLQPATRHYVAMGYTYDQSYTVELFYRNVSNDLSQLVFQDNDTNLMRFVSSNIDKDESYGIDFMLNKEITDFWYCYVGSSIFNNSIRFMDLISNAPVENSQWMFYLKTYNSFSLLTDKSLTLDLTFDYVSSTVSQNAVQGSYNELGLSLRKTFWNRRASLAMGITDMFRQGNIFTTRRYADQDNTSYYRPESRLFTLGFRYKFGNTIIRDNTKSKGVEERNRL